MWSFILQRSTWRHNDILAGAVVTNQATIAEKLVASLVTRGQVLDPFSAWLLLRSLKTLHLRMGATS